MYKIAYKNLGCRVNSFELELIKKQFMNHNAVEVDFDDISDIYIINTCSVTHIADRKSRQMINRAKDKNKNAVVVAIGCFVDSHIDDLDHNIDIYIPNSLKNNTFEIIKTYCVNKKILNIDEFDNIINENNIDKSNNHVRAFVKIEDGCNQFCSYCIIPYLRGRINSIKEDDVIKQIEDLIKEGKKEIVLTGIHLSSYGLDFYNMSYNDKNAIDVARNNLLSLIKRIYNYDEIKRIRLGSLEPRIINEYFIDELYKLKNKFCFEFHLSLQSGSDEILKLMNRHYTTDDYRKSVKIIRDKYLNSSITTDIIVGFPNETIDNFNETVDFVKEIRFYNPHIFKYSKRERTKAYDMKNQISDEEKNTRSNELINLSFNISNEIRKSNINQMDEILVEEIEKQDNINYLVGYNKEYIKIKCIVDNEYAKKINILGSIINVKIIDIKDDFLLAKF